MIVAKDAFPLWLTEHAPLNGADEVGVTFKPKVSFSKPIDPLTLDENSFYATFGSAKIPATIVPSGDAMHGWLFFADALPGSSRIEITVDGDLTRSIDGSFLDADGDGVPGGSKSFVFSTVSLLPLPGTSLTGVVLDPGPDNLPHTADDRPLPGVEVFLLGREGVRVTTDAAGRFELSAVPGGNVKVAVDGRTAGAPPDDSSVYFPEMVMDANMTAGQENFVMLGMEKMYLPRLQSSILTDVDASQAQTITVPPEGALNLTEEQRSLLTLEVPAGSLLAADGQLLAGGQVGISTVPPELVRDMLPPGVLQHTFDITIQTTGISNFATPAPMSFPNVFDASPGTKLDFLSFDHNTGRLVIEGTATVSTDGQSVATDPGTGITHPGWHGMIPPGTEVIGGCDPTVLRDIVVTPVAEFRNTFRNLTAAGTGIGFTVKQTRNLQDHLIFSDLDTELHAPSSHIIVFNDAKKIDAKLPACTGVNQRATPLIVDIAFDKVADEFLSEVGSRKTGLLSRKIALQPGQLYEFQIEPVPKLDARALRSQDVDVLFGTRATITGYGLTSPDDQLLAEDGLFYRFVDVADDDHRDGIIDFADTMADGSGGEVTGRRRVIVVSQRSCDS